MSSLLNDDISISSHVSLHFHHYFIFQSEIVSKSTKSAATKGGNKNKRSNSSKAPKPKAKKAKVDEEFDDNDFDENQDHGSGILLKLLSELEVNSMDDIPVKVWNLL